MSKIRTADTVIVAPAPKVKTDSEFPPFEIVAAFVIVTVPVTVNDEPLTRAIFPATVNVPVTTHVIEPLISELLELNVKSETVNDEHLEFVGVVA